MINARKLAVALQQVRDGYNCVDGKVLIPSHTVITYNSETNDINAPYTNDDTVTLSFGDGSVYALNIELLKEAR